MICIANRYPWRNITCLKFSLSLELFSKEINTWNANVPYTDIRKRFYLQISHHRQLLREYMAVFDNGQQQRKFKTVYRVGAVKRRDPRHELCSRTLGFVSGRSHCGLEQLTYPTCALYLLMVITFKLLSGIKYKCIFRAKNGIYITSIL